MNFIKRLIERLRQWLKEPEVKKPQDTNYPDKVGPDDGL